MITPSEDATHLKLLAVSHLIYGALQAMLACIPILFIIPGIYMLLEPDHSTVGAEIASISVAWVMIAGAGLVMIIGWISALLQFYTGWCITRRKHFRFCLVMACLSCLSIPFGTVLGVFSLIVLCRTSVKALFTGQLLPGALVIEPLPQPLDEIPAS